MKVGIICAGDEELAPFLSEMEKCRTSECAMLNCHEGLIHGVQTAALFSGVCKVNAAIAAQVLIDRFGVDILINSGTAGGVHPGLRLFDTVISTEACYHDVAGDILTEFHPWMKSVFFKADDVLLECSKSAAEKTAGNGNVFWGRMATGESFVTDEGRDRISSEYAPLTADMETAAIAHVCYVNSIPFIAVRCITDTAEHSGISSFEKNCATASAIAKNITVALIKELSVRTRC